MNAQPTNSIGPRSATSGKLFQQKLGITLLSFCLFSLSFNLHAAQTLNRKPGWPGTTLGGEECYGKLEGYGPFDYVSEKSKIGIVEQYHFKPSTEQLNDTVARLDGDLNYTLRAVPNHHRALWARSRFYLRRAKHSSPNALIARERSQQGNPPPECYFQRAQVFNPNDGMVSAIFGIYLHKRDKLQAALTEYQQAEKKIPEHAELIYNMGLLYFDMDNLEKAREYADRAKSLGYPLEGLHRKVSRADAGGNKNSPAPR